MNEDKVEPVGSLIRKEKGGAKNEIRRIKTICKKSKKK